MLVRKFAEPEVFVAIAASKSNRFGGIEAGKESLGLRMSRIFDVSSHSKTHV